MNRRPFATRGSFARCRWPAGERGATILEFALTLPILLTFMLAIVGLTIAVSFYSTLAQVARDGARFAMVRGSSPGNLLGQATAADVRAYVQMRAGFGTATQVTTTWSPNKDPGSVVQVTAQLVFRPPIPFVPIEPLTISSTSRMTVAF